MGWQDVDILLCAAAALRESRCRSQLTDRSEAMLIAHAPNVWSVHHTFKVRGLTISSRMTVLRLDGRLWLHSPVPISGRIRQALGALGPVAWLVAPSRAHVLFLAQASQAFPDAKVWVAPGAEGSDTVPRKGEPMDAAALQQWAPSLKGVLLEGMPEVNETLWFHAPSGTLIVTDWLQWWRGDLPLATRLWAHAMAVRQGPGVSRMFRHLIRDPAAFDASLSTAWTFPVTRVLLGHNAELDAHGWQQVVRAHSGPGR